MDDWLPLSEVTLGDASTPVSAIESAQEHEIGTCAVSGRRMLKAEMLAYGDAWIAPDRKEEFLQRLRENASVGGVADSGDENDAVGSLEFGYLMKRGFRLFKRNFGLLAALYFTIWIPCNFLMEYIDYEFNEGMGSIKLQRFFDNFFGIIAFGGIVHALMTKTNRQTPSYGDAIGTGFKFWGKLWITRFIVTICVVLSFIALILPGIYVTVRLMCSFTVVITEDNWATDAIRRSFELTKGRFWILLGYGTLILSVIVVFAITLAIPFVMIPELDNWMVVGVLDCLVGIAEIYAIVMFFTIYDELLQLEQ